MKKWLYKGVDPAELNDVYSVGPEGEERQFAMKAELIPGETFDAPDDWLPVPDPHPLFEPAPEAAPEKPKRSNGPDKTATPEGEVPS